MAAFRFALQPVLNQRQRTEEERLVAVAELERQRIEIEDQIRVLQGRIEFERSELRSGLDATVQIAAIRMQAATSLHAVAEAQKLVFRLAGLLQRIKAARAKLVEAIAARKALELLKERRHAEWKASLNRQEDRMLDDVGTFGAIRSAQGEEEGCVGGDGELNQIMPIHECEFGKDLT
ncbi:MAG: flagellar FliJ family protein [Planctomycetes bacterium]|nr:flagellar FliJ family protein [Planctomycetota bacterium]